MPSFQISCIITLFTKSLQVKSSMSCFLDICEHSSLKHQCNIQVVFVISFDLNTCCWHDFYLLHPQSICYTMSSQTCTDEYLIPNQKCIYLHARYHICKQGGCNDNAALFCYTSQSSCEMKGICMWSALITGSQSTTLILQYNFPSILVITICFHILTLFHTMTIFNTWCFIW